MNATKKHAHEWILAVCLLKNTTGDVVCFLKRTQSYCTEQQFVFFFSDSVLGNVFGSQNDAQGVSLKYLFK